MKSGAQVRVIGSAALDAIERVLQHLSRSKLTITGLLGHCPRGVTQAYIHLDTAFVTAAEEVAMEIATILDDGTGSSADVFSRCDWKRHEHLPSERCSNGAGWTTSRSKGGLPAHCLTNYRYRIRRPR